MKTINIILVFISCLLYLISMILNSLGIYLLSATRPLNSSKILLINLSDSEIFVAMMGVVFNILRAVLPIETMLKIGIIFATSYIAYYFAMFMLTVDRLIGVVLPLKHRVIVTEQRLTLAIVTSWFIALLLQTCFSILSETFHLDSVLLKYIWIALDAVFIILCAITYGLIFIKVLKKKRLENNQQDGRGNSRLFKITALIILSFLLLMLVPDIVLYFHSMTNKTAIECLNIVWSLGFVADPIIYIFLQDHLRLLLKTKLCTCKKEVTQESDNNQQNTAL